MDSGVKMCVDARLNMFSQYYTVPENVAADVDAFCRELTALGESSPDVASFEAAFASKGFSNRFNTLLSVCVPKPYQMNAQEQAHADETAREIFQEDKDRIKKEFIEDIGDSVQVKLDSDLAVARRRIMTEAGVMDEYTKISNITEDIGIVGRGLKSLFGKKKK